jgi:predicted  nucleic acid-binding Zn-ribbon protein
MGPTNVALVNYYRADQRVREAQARLDAATKDVRIQERRVNDLAEKHKLAASKLKEAQSKQAQLDLDLKTRDAHIEKLRTQQQNAKNNKEYQAFLVEINTEKVDRSKVEEELLKLMEQVEKQQIELKDMGALLDSEKSKLEGMRTQITGKTQELQSEIDQLKPERDAAAAAVPAKAREQYDKLADRWEGEALSAIAKPDRRREEYMCSACHMDLVIDVYNRLHSRDDLVFCPSCRRILYIPDDLPPEVAIKKSAPKKISQMGGGKKQEEETIEDVIGRVMIKAAGESARNAVAAGNDPVEFDVFVDGKPVGSYKGQSVENLQRTAQFCLQEAGLGGTVTVAEKASESTPTT